MFDIWREIFQNVTKNKLRSILTGVTVAFSILLFTLLFGVVNGFKNSFMKNFKDDASNAIFIHVGSTSKAYKGFQSGRRIRFENKDYNYIKKQFGDDIEFITGRVFRGEQISYKGNKDRYSIRAVHPDHKFLEVTVMQTGRYITNLDLKKRAKNIVIGRLVEKDLFEGRSALGKQLNLGGINFKVVGVFSDDGGEREERTVYMPITTAQGIYGNNQYIDQFVLSSRKSMSVDEAIAFGKKIENILKARFNIAPNDQSALRMQNMSETNKEVNSFFTILTVFVFVIAFGTLIAGIIGVSNIMVYIVKERTKELGIRKALGAPPSHIISMVLYESVFLTMISGYIGLLLGGLILDWSSELLEDYGILNPSVETSQVVGATLILVVSGAVAGFLPARRAARIKPVVALRAD